MAEYLTPGVYYERVDSGAPPIAPLQTDVAGLVGIARRGPAHSAVPIESWRQFQAWFGDVTGAGYLAYAARGFFECGGRRVWIVRVISPAAAPAAARVGSATLAEAWRVIASSPGAWGDDLDVRLVETHRAQTRSRLAGSTPEHSTVESVAGFFRGTHVRVPIAPGVVLHRIVAFVDADEKRLHWIHPDPRLRQPWEQPLAGVDPNVSAVIESIEYTLLVYAEARLVARYEDLSLVPEHPRYGPAVVPGLPTPPLDERGWNVPLAPPLVAIEELREPASIALAEPLAVPPDRVPLVGGVDGLSTLSVRDFIGEATSPLDSDGVIADRRRGLRALERAREVSIVAVPDIHIQPVPPPEQRPPVPCMPDPCLPPPPPLPAAPRPRAIGDLPPIFDEADVFLVQMAMIDHCETLRDRVALLDAPYETARNPRLGLAAIRAWRRRFDSSFGALYFPWLAVSDPLRSGGAPTRPIPPSGHVAGFIAQTDLRVGVHKAPANGPLAWVQDLTVAIDDVMHGVLNPSHVNAIRAFPGRGLRVYGARTLASDPDWRFLNVRRLLLMIEEAVALAIQWAVFEPNDSTTRSKLHLSLTSFLLELWQRGALAGSTPQEGFFVRCDEENNPPDARANGRLLAEVGVAAAKPFEFVVLRVGRVDNQFEIVEAGTVAGGAGMNPFGDVSSRHDPPLNHNFLVSLVDSSSPLALGVSIGVTALGIAGGFSECTGLEMAMQPEEYKEGGRNGAVLKFPSRVTWTNLTLKKGAGLGSDLWDWHYGFVVGAGRRRDGVITLLDATRTPVSVWFFRRGLPVKYTGPAFNATQNTVAIETIEIAHEGLHLVPGFGLGAVVGALAGSVG